MRATPPTNLILYWISATNLGEEKICETPH